MKLFRLILRLVIDQLKNDMAAFASDHLTYRRKIERAYFALLFSKEFCKTQMNPDRDDELKSINTSACEQVNSWLKGFSHILSNMNETNFIATLLLLLHLRNCDHTSISCRTVNARSSMEVKRCSFSS